MSKEIYISSTPHETRLAIVESDVLTEIYYERENEYTLAGSIYNGRVTRVLPGMQSSFVEIGLERDAFLYITDFMEEAPDAAEFDTTPHGEQPPRPRLAATEPAVEGEGRAPERAERSERSGRGRRGGRSGNQERGGERPAGDASPRTAGNGRTEAPQVAQPPVAANVDSQAEAGEVGEGAPGADGSRRWRGRRGRRRGRGGAAQGGEAARLDGTTADAGTEAEFEVSGYGAEGFEEPQGGLEIDGAASAEAPLAPAAQENRGGRAEAGRTETARSESGRDGGRRDGRRDRNDRPREDRPREDRPRDAQRSGQREDRGQERTPRGFVPASERYGVERGDAARGSSSTGPVENAYPDLNAGPEPEPFLLPGESLSKYRKGGDEPAARAVDAAPAPATISYVAAGWDGGSTLPG
jgi:ribonuclease E